MKVVDSIVELFRRLREADDQVQAATQDLFRRYYGFLSGSRWQSARNLRLRRHRDREGRVRAIAWSRRIDLEKLVNGRAIRLARELSGPFQPAWIYHIARDWANRERYYAFEGERRRQVRASQQGLKARRGLRLALLYAWAPKAIPQDLAQAAEIVAHEAPVLGERDVRPIAGALVLEREAGLLEAELSGRVEEYRVAFLHRPDVGFKPFLTPRPNGRLRLLWGFPQNLHTSHGVLRITERVPGGRPADAWMRKRGLSAAVRKEVASFVRPLRRLERSYDRICAFLAGHRRRVHELVHRVARIWSRGAAPPCGAAADPLS